MRKKILAVMEKSSKIDIKDLTVLLGESEVAVANEIAETKKEHIVCGYHTLISWDSTSDEEVITLIEVKVIPQRGMEFDKIAEWICQYSEVEAVYLMSGAYGFTMFIEGRTMKQVALLMSDKPSPVDPILNATTHFMLKKYEDHGAMLADTIQDERMLITPRETHCLIPS